MFRWFWKPLVTFKATHVPSQKSLFQSEKLFWKGKVGFSTKKISISVHARLPSKNETNSIKIWNLIKNRKKFINFKSIFDKSFPGNQKRQKIGATCLQGIFFPRNHIPRNLLPRKLFSEEFFFQGIFFPRNFFPKKFFSEEFFFQWNLFPRNFFSKEIFFRGIFISRNFSSKEF